MYQYPVLLSIPHGGDRIPPEVDAYTQLSAHDLVADSDAFTREIYAISDEVVYVAEASIARAFVDLNRPITALPPEQPDGVIKSHTCHGEPVYRDALWRDQTLVDALVHDLLTKYYHPYHRTLETQLAAVRRSDPDDRLSFDGGGRPENRTRLRCGAPGHLSRHSVWGKL